MVYLIDTNILLRAFVKENERTYKECSKLLNLIEDTTLKARLPGIALSECFWTMKSFYKCPKPFIHESLQGMLDLFSGKIVDNYNYPLTLNLLKQHPTASLSDCLMASLPEIQSGLWTIVSYDKDFDKLGLKRLEPKDLLT